MALSWLYIETKDVAKVESLSKGIMWAVIPSLVFFAVLPILLQTKLSFWSCLILACLVTAVAYVIYTFILSKMGITF